MKTTALIVEDDLSVLLALTNVLRLEDYLVIQASSGEEATESIQNHPDIDIVVLDLNLPHKSGWDVFRDVRLALPLVPVVEMTADADQEDREKAVGVAALLEKPLGIPRFLKTITDLMAEGPAARRLDCRSARSHAKTESPVACGIAVE
jgi:CheY-like chemotaxis protein